MRARSIPRRTSAATSARSIRGKAPRSTSAKCNISSGTEPWRSRKISRAVKDLPAKRKNMLEKAKEEPRAAFGR
ncbi:MAG: DUF3175 domain-containing protein [Sphingomonadales bacterium]|nr:DUF3175 domain-containing protein [Sphingomonadales bacterium]